MARYSTRLGKHCLVEALLPDGRRITGRCNMARGRSARIIELQWSGEVRRPAQRGCSYVVRTVSLRWAPGKGACRCAAPHAVE